MLNRERVKALPAVTRAAPHELEQVVPGEQGRCLVLHIIKQLSARRLQGGALRMLPSLPSNPGASAPELAGPGLPGGLASLAAAAEVGVRDGCVGGWVVADHLHVCLLHSRDELANTDMKVLVFGAFETGARGRRKALSFVLGSSVSLIVSFPSYRRDAVSLCPRLGAVGSHPTNNEARTQSGEVW